MRKQKITTTGGPPEADYYDEATALQCLACGLASPIEEFDDDGEIVSRAEALRPALEELAGRSARAIAAELNARGIATANGGKWQSTTVIRVQRRLKPAPGET